MAALHVLLLAAALLTASPSYSSALLSSRYYTKMNMVLVALTSTESAVKQAVDNAPESPSPGDLFTWTEDVADTMKDVVGTSSGFCLTTLPNKHNQCSWTIAFDGRVDTIVVSGQSYEEGPSMLPVSGGTGKYKRAAGYVISTPLDDGNFHYNYTIWCPK